MNFFWVFLKAKELSPCVITAGDNPKWILRLNSWNTEVTDEHHIQL